MSPVALGPYRVVELSSERTAFCGKILRDLGADVITVEPLDGSDARRFGPYANDAPGLETSLAWWADNRDKRSLALDVTTDAGRDILARLLERRRLPRSRASTRSATPAWGSTTRRWPRASRG